ncbi:hypothetical protein AVT69_gp308 [Pseudomonas phage PhiPA3]|uniref:Uncharacterized protein 310 n=1 Tax=Pseudomonas phage PhiPA3 TaxID=998086 RepID=F8SJE6_BPPA3|nr:hypothetical protein AVT69_gp308 [Pseudomonas phage PhiPA3]AEH03733.1 hypothetical protein [Pseudomonas phage PhiPA3]
MAEVKFEITSDKAHLGKTLLGAELVRQLRKAGFPVVTECIDGDLECRVEDDETDHNHRLKELGKFFQDNGHAVKVVEYLTVPLARYPLFDQQTRVVMPVPNGVENPAAFAEEVNAAVKGIFERYGVPPEAYAKLRQSSLYGRPLSRAVLELDKDNPDPSHTAQLVQDAINESAHRAFPLGDPRDQRQDVSDAIANANNVVLSKKP